MAGYGGWRWGRARLRGEGEVRIGRGGRGVIGRWLGTVLPAEGGQGDNGWHGNGWEGSGREVVGDGKEWQGPVGSRTVRPAYRPARLRMDKGHGMPQQARLEQAWLEQAQLGPSLWRYSRVRLSRSSQRQAAYSSPRYSPTKEPTGRPPSRSSTAPSPCEESRRRGREWGRWELNTWLHAAG